MLASIKDFGQQLDLMLTKLAERRKHAARNRKYLDGCSPIPDAIEKAGLTTSYRLLMELSNAPWASLIVDSKQDRLEVGGVNTGDQAIDDAVWGGVWQANELDAESKLGHQAVLENGRAVAFCWPDADGEPEVTIDGADQAIVLYAEGRHRARHRVAALREWTDGDKAHCTLYRADGLFKFVEADEQRDTDKTVMAVGKWWEQREVDGEEWPVPNPFGVVPGVEILTNRRLSPGAFPFARGEFAHCHGLLSRIDLLTFLGLVVAVWMGFPLRGVIGDKILRTDDGEPIAPFDMKPNEVAQLENPDAKTFEFKAADRGNLSIFDELAQLAYVTKTPAHYLPMSGGLSNISADAIRALEGAMHAQVDGIHKPFIGSGWEELLRVGGLMLPEPVRVPASASVFWLDKQSRSLAEMADAATKLKDILPTVMIAEKYLSFTQQELGRLRAAAAGTTFDRLLAAAAEPAPVEDTGGESE